VPVKDLVRKIQEHHAEAYAMVMAYSPAEVGRRCHRNGHPPTSRPAALCETTRPRVQGEVLPEIGPASTETVEFCVYFRPLRTAFTVLVLAQEFEPPPAVDPVRGGIDPGIQECESSQSLRLGKRHLPPFREFIQRAKWRIIGDDVCDGLKELDIGMAALAGTLDVA